MSILQWLDIIYLADVLLCAAYIASKLSYLFIVRGRLALVPKPVLRWVQIVISVEIICWCIELAILFALSVMTGENPRFSIDEYRHYVAIARALQVLGFLTGTVITTISIGVFIYNSGER